MVYVESHIRKLKKDSLVDQKLDKTHICGLYKAALQSKSIYNLLDLVPKVIYILRAADGMSINDVNIFEGGHSTTKAFKIVSR